MRMLDTQQSIVKETIKNPAPSITVVLVFKEKLNSSHSYLH